MTRRHALIVGGGIGGLATAIGLKRVGWTVQLFERAPELREVGAAVQTWANASNAMDKLGVLDTYAAAAQRIGDFHVYSKTGKLLIDLDIPRVERETGYSAYSSHRHELIEVLARFLDPSEVRLTAEICSFSNLSRGGVRLKLATGEAFEGDLLVGSDGINSMVRAQINENRPKARRPRYAGYVAFRGIADWQDGTTPPPLAHIAIGDSLQVGYYPMTKGRAYWFVTMNTEQGPTRSGPEAKAEILRRIRHWTSPYPQIVEATPEDTVLENDISDFYPNPVWGEGHITLAGDSAHATTPNIGQGACMALEDAVALARAVREPGDLPAQLRAYERERFHRTKGIVGQSKLIGNLIQTESRLANFTRDAVLRMLPSGFISSRTFDIYSHRSPALV